MSQIARAFEELEDRWKKLIEARPEEIFKAFPDLSPQQLSDAINQLGTVIAALEEKGLFDSSPELAVALPLIVGKLKRASGPVHDAVANGLDWLGGTSFLEDFTEAQSLIAALTARRTSLTREIAKELSKKGLAELERVLAAGEAAASVIESRKKVDEGVASTDASVSKAKAAVEAIQTVSNDANSSITEIRRLEAESMASALAATDAETIFDGSARAITKLKDDADAREVALDLKVKETSDQVAALMQEALEAKQNVKDALRLARDQGLAESFQSRSTILHSERRLWTIVFVGAIAVLATLSTVFVAELTDLTYRGLIITLLRKLALAAPTVWLGWYAARQIGRVARVQEDYEYKAASALAYQSYKDEAALGADPSLITLLLKHAIDTFGENPVRLYADASADPVTPLESGLKALPPDKLIALLTAALEASGRKR
jgi:hypothetical protein